jgi:cell division initiation protein
MTITPIDIQQQRFKTRAMGYEKVGVDHFLEQVAEELEQYHRMVQELKEELARTRVSLNEMREREEMLKETLMTAQRMTEEIKGNALKEAEILMAEAGLKAERIVQEAEDQRNQLLNEVQEIKRQKATFQAALRGLVESHLHLLDFEAVTDDRQSRQGKFLQAPSDKQEEKPSKSPPFSSPDYGSE